MSFPVQSAIPLRNILTAVLASVALAGSLSSAAADDQPNVSKMIAQPQTPVPPILAWEDFLTELRQLAPAMLAKLPERLRNDPQTQQEIGRLMLEALATATIEAIAADGDHPMFLPVANFILNNAFQPNADTTYRKAVITPGGSYRLRGYVGSLRIFKLAQFGPDKATIRAFAYHDFSELHVDSSGHFDVILSPARPDGYRGDWWLLDPKTNSLMIRQVAYDWSIERDPTIAIERLDAPARKSRPPAAELESRLRRLTKLTTFTAILQLDHVESLRRDGYINKFKEFDVSNLGALAGQFYYEGAYELKNDEALIVEARVPEKCRYASTILTNDIFETIDWYNNQSSLNGSQVRVDRDGILRIVVSAKDPGVPNWLDTAGYSSGTVQGRWTECSAKPIPAARKVALDDVRRHLPADTPLITPSQRDQIVRDRRAQLQQRPLW